MKQMNQAFALTLILTALIYIGFYFGEQYKNQDKQHLKLIRKGCCQFRINEYTNEVKHFEGCENLAHFNN